MGEVMDILKVPKTDLSVAEAVTLLEAADVPCTICERRDTLSDNAQIDAIGALETYVTENIGKLTRPHPACLVWAGRRPRWPRQARPWGLTAAPY